MLARLCSPTLLAMPCFMLHHRHEPRECPAVFAAWSGFQSPLRREPAIGSCLFDDHQIWWRVEAANEEDALARLPWFVAARTTATRIAEVPIP
jgi:hypothetical protein